MSRILIIPDAHAHPEYSNIRFTWLRNLIVAEQPEIIVCLGDFADMPSLATQSSAKEAEGRRYRRDIQAAYRAMDLLLESWPGTYAPKMYLTMGNHEDRIDRFVGANPVLEEKMNIEDTAYPDWGWDVYPFKEVLEIKGFHFAHYFPSGIVGRPIGGDHHAAALLNKLHVSSVVGHSHLLGYAQRTDAAGRKLHGIVAGCWVHPDYKEPWCRNTTKLWYHGVTILEDAKHGDFGSMQVISMKTVKNRYR